MEFAPAEPLDRDQCAAHRFVVAQRIAFQKRFDLDRACVNDIRIRYAVGLECAELICGDHLYYRDDGNIRFPHLVGGIKHRFIGGDDDAYIISTALDGIKVINEIRVEIPRAKQLPPQQTQPFRFGSQNIRGAIPFPVRLDRGQAEVDPACDAENAQSHDDHADQRFYQGKCTPDL